MFYHCAASFTSYQRIIQRGNKHSWISPYGTKRECAISNILRGSTAAHCKFLLVLHTKWRVCCGLPGEVSNWCVDLCIEHVQAMFTASPTSTSWWIWDLQRLHWLSLARPTNWTCSSSHLHAKVQKSLFCQRRTFQSTSTTAAEANTGAGFPECCLHLSASSSSEAKRSWPLLYINFCLSPEDIWRAHLLQKMCTAECQQHTKAKDSPEVSNTCWKAEQKGQYSWGCICQGHKRQEIRCFSWSSGVFHFSLPLSFQSFDTAGVIGGQTTFISLFFSLIFSSRSDHPFLQLLAGKSSTQAGTVRWW